MASPKLRFGGGGDAQVAGGGQPHADEPDRGREQRAHEEREPAAERDHLQFVRGVHGRVDSCHGHLLAMMTTVSTTIRTPTTVNCRRR